MWLLLNLSLRRIWYRYKSLNSRSTSSARRQRPQFRFPSTLTWQCDSSQKYQGHRACTEKPLHLTFFLENSVSLWGENKKQARVLRVKIWSKHEDSVVFDVYIRIWMVFQYSVSRAKNDCVHLFGQRCPRVDFEQRAYFYFSVLFESENDPPSFTNEKK